MPASRSRLSALAGAHLTAWMVSGVVPPHLPEAINCNRPPRREESPALTVIGLSGSLTRPSRTTALVATILDRIVQQDARQGKLIELVDEAPHLFAALSRRALTGRAAAVVAAVEQAELLIVGTPVYRASYTGALKHL